MIANGPPWMVDAPSAVCCPRSHGMGYGLIGFAGSWSIGDVLGTSSGRGKWTSTQLIVIARYTLDEIDCPDGCMD